MSKRTPNGRSSIYHSDTDGRWHGWVTMGVKPDGKPDRRHRTAKDEAGVTRKVQELERQRDEGSSNKPGGRLRMAAWVEKYLTEIGPLTLAPSSVYTYESLARNWVVPHLGEHWLDQLEPEYLDALYSRMFAKGLSTAYVSAVHWFIAHLLKVAMKRRKIKHSVADLVELPKLVQREIHPYDQAESRAILTEAHSRRNGARWSVALSVGTRQGETLGLRWDYINLETGETSVSWQISVLRWQHGCEDPHACGKRLHKVTACPKDCAKHKRCPKPCTSTCTRHAASCPDRHGGGPVFRVPKGQKRRTVFLPPEQLVVLKAHKAAQARERLAAGAAWQDHGLVFCGPDGRPIHMRDDRLEWKSILQAAGIRDGRVHDCRHTAGTLLIGHGTHIRVVQEMFGHSTLRHTQRYLHVGSDAAREAAGRMGATLFGS